MTVYSLMPEPLGYYNLYFEQIDGDTRQVECADQSGDPFLPNRRPNRTDAFRWGRAVETEHLPTKLRPKSAQKRMPDYVTVGMGQIASAAFRDVAGALESGVHQFEPVTIVNKRGEVLAEMYWFVPCNRLDTLAPDLLDPPLDDLGLYTGNSNTRRCVFDAAKVGDAHVWIDARMIGGYLFASQGFKDAAERAGLKGVKFGPQETINLSPAVETGHGW